MKREDLAEIRNSDTSRDGTLDRGGCDFLDTEIQKDRPCVCCNGLGKQMKWDGIWIICPACNGTGYMPSDNYPYNPYNPLVPSYIAWC